MSEDPIGFGGGDVNLFGYVLNSPIRFKDPYGKQRVDATWKTFSPDDAERLRYSIDNMGNRTKELYELGYRPENFQCGPSPFSTLGSLGSGDFNQRPSGYNFKDGPCYNHDACYQVCGSDKNQCDQNFRRELSEVCDSGGSYFQQLNCRLRAGAYSWLVENAGDGAYTECQTYVCPK